MPFDQTNFVEAKPEVELEPWRRVLLDAAQYIREHGWCQNSVRTDDGRVCAIGAIGMAYDAAFHNSRCCEIAITAMNHLDATLARKGHLPDIVKFNDAPGRTAEEVARAMEECARQP